jgi:RecB family exonuclease
VSTAGGTADRFLSLSWLSKLMAGESSCEWAAWFRARHRQYKRTPPSVDLAQWSVQHTQLLSQLAHERDALGETTYRENQNAIKLGIAPGMLLGGKPDLVSIAPDGTATVYDTKTGKPRQSDLIQVMLAMLCLPRHSRYADHAPLEGCVVYGSGERTAIPAAAVHPEFKARARFFVDLLNSEVAPRRSPSVEECRFCDISKEHCPDRVEPADEEAGAAIAFDPDWK